MQNAQSCLVVVGILNLAVVRGKPLGENKDEQINCQGEVVNGFEHFEVILNDGRKIFESNIEQEILHVIQKPKPLLY